MKRRIKKLLYYSLLVISDICYLVTFVSLGAILLNNKATYDTSFVILPFWILILIVASIRSSYYLGRGSKYLYNNWHAIKDAPRWMIRGIDVMGVVCIALFLISYNTKVLEYGFVGGMMFSSYYAIVIYWSGIKKGELKSDGLL